LTAAGCDFPLRLRRRGGAVDYPGLEVMSIDLYSCKSISAACIMAFTTGRSG